MFNISIIHPSRSRPLQANSTIKKWLGRAKNPENIEYILSADKSDKDLRRYKEVGLRNGIFVSINNNKTAIQAINKATKVSTANLIIQIADDFSCEENWDEKLLKALEGKEDYLVKTQDGIQPYIITLPIMDRKYYNRFGYIYNPSYLHLWVDLELTDVGHILGKVITLDLMFEHLHYSKGKTKKDTLNVRNDKSWKQGEKLYNERKLINFGL